MCWSIKLHYDLHYKNTDKTVTTTPRLFPVWMRRDQGVKLHDQKHEDRRKMIWIKEGLFSSAQLKMSDSYSYSTSHHPTPQDRHFWPCIQCNARGAWHGSIQLHVNRKNILVNGKQPCRMCCNIIEKATSSWTLTGEVLFCETLFRETPDFKSIILTLLLYKHCDNQ